MERQTKTIGIIHAVNLTIRAMQPFLERYIPDVEVMHLCDDTIQRDNIAAGVGVIPKNNYFRFAQYAHNLQEAGVDLILLACSTFNYAAELARPMIDVPIMQIDRPMMELAVSQGSRVGLLAHAGHDCSLLRTITAHCGCGKEASRRDYNGCAPRSICGHSEGGQRNPQ